MRHTFASATVVLAAVLSGACGSDAVSSPTAPSASPAAGIVKTLQVAPSRVDCVGVAPQSCLLVRENAGAPWTNLYEPIVGFEYEPGFLYEIRIKEEAVSNPPADASSIKRTLIAVLSKTPAAAGVLGTTWRLESIEGRAALAGVRVTAVFDKDSRVAGSAGCNGYFGAAALDGDKLKVGSLATTLMHCGAPGVMPQEQAYLADLGAATVSRVIGGKLELGPSPAIVTLVFRAE